MDECTSYTEKDRKRSGEHILVRLTYIGKTPQDYSAMSLTRDLEHWRKYNQENGITSALAINETYFIHSIEGTRPNINQAMRKVTTEYMRVVPNVVEVEEISAPKWGYYWLKYLTPSVENEDYTLESFSAGADFNPYLMKGTQLTSFLSAVFKDKVALAER